MKFILFLCIMFMTLIGLVILSYFFANIIVKIIDKIFDKVIVNIFDKEIK